MFIKPRHSNTYYRTDQEYPKKFPLHPDQGRGVPQLAQNLPLFTVPQAQVHSSEAGLGWPHSAQNLIIPTIISLVLCVFVLVCMWIIFRKANKPGWAAIVPFYNLYVMFEITWGSGWRFLLMLIPIYNIILGIQTQ